MNIKKTALIFLVFLTLILSIGVISAADDNGNVLSSNNYLDEKAVSADTKVVSQSTDVVNSDVKKASEITAKPKIKTKVEADQVAVVYKKNNYLKIEIEDQYDNEVSNVKLNVKVATGSNAKTFQVKTNAYGIAKLNTKSLKVGVHNVVITSADDGYDIHKTSKIFVGKQYKVTLKSKAKKVLKNKDVIGLKIRNDFNEKDVKLVFKKTPKYTKIIKAIFYFKNNNGYVVKKTDKSDFDDGKWELPDEEYSNKFSLVKVKVYYISTK